MKKLFVLTVALLGIAALHVPAHAAKCSPTGVCTACKNCSGCKNCAEEGGSCSTCRQRDTFTKPNDGQAGKQEEKVAEE